MHKGFFIVGFALAVSAARTACALTVSPARTEIQQAPGASMKAFITATNETVEKIQVEVSKKDWFVYEANKRLTVDRWLDIKGATYFWLKPGESRTVPIKVRCPKNAQGELVGMVSFAYQSESPGMVTPVISVSVYNTVSGTEKRSGEITKLVARTWQGTFQAAAVVKATGNVHLRPSGQMLIRSENGELLATLTVKEGDPAYPGQERGYVGQDASIHLKPGRYQVEAQLSSHGIPLRESKSFQVKSDGNIVMDSEKAVIPAGGGSQ